MEAKDWINIAAIIVIPIVAVLIGQYLQNRAKKREDKLQIFKTLMTARMLWLGLMESKCHVSEVNEEIMHLYLYLR